MRKVAIVTGASRGIGAATAKALADENYNICINYNNSVAEANNIVEYFRAKNLTAIAVKADMASEENIVNMFAIVDEELGPVTALVNNAGINGGSSKVEDIRIDILQSVFATNVFGTFIACREAVKRMKKVNYGNIVNITSEAAKFGGTNMAHYAASKAAINTFTIGFAREVAAHNIRVNAVSPGVIDTEMNAHLPADKVANLLKTMPMGRMGKADEVAKVIIWLLSNQSSYVNGAIVPITGSR